MTEARPTIEEAVAQLLTDLDDHSYPAIFGDDIVVSAGALRTLLEHDASMTARVKEATVLIRAVRVYDDLIRRLPANLYSALAAFASKNNGAE